MQRQKSPERQRQDQRQVDHELHHVLSLLVARSRGEVTNDAVENAVTHLLASTGNSQHTAKESAEESQQPQHPKPIQTNVSDTLIAADDDDYDDNDDNDCNHNGKSSASRPIKRSRTDLNSDSAQKTNCRKSTSPKSEESNKAIKEDVMNQLLDQIPLGRQGAKMMTTFGDGPYPRPDAVAMTLRGARQMIQVAIRDARALRRRAKQQFDLAKANVNSQSDKKKTNRLASHAAASAIDSTMLYRATGKHDQLTLDPKCGFDLEQLKVLFPEEMNAYTRWNEMHSEYVASTGKDEDLDTSQNPDLDSSKGEMPEHLSYSEETVGGHLKERVAHFDTRTRGMDEDWYLKFAEIRRGSFLPRGNKMPSMEHSDAVGTRKHQQQLQQQHWENRPISSIRFLHWLGFDPRSSLPPPDELTTHVLAFLCYDFFGRIVEKAICLRNKREHPDNDDADLITTDVNGDGQLECLDIELALQDPETCLAPVCARIPHSSTEMSRTQLYFGPGFEERLELEMEEFLSGPDRNFLSEEELEAQVEEDELFRNMLNPPCLDNVGAQLLKDS